MGITRRSEYVFRMFTSIRLQQVKFTRRFVSAIFFLVVSLLFLETDRCLYTGGQWNEEEKICEISENNKSTTVFI